MKSRIINTIFAAGLSAAVGMSSTMALAGPFEPNENAPEILLVKNKGYKGKDFHRRGGNAYYHGHKGYHSKRDGYRYYNGFWFPLAAFGLGAIVGSAAARSGNSNNAHVDWCYDHYRSYRVYDNTFQPYHGPRRQCYSPYS